MSLPTSQLRSCPTLLRDVISWPSLFSRQLYLIRSLLDHVLHSSLYLVPFFLATTTETSSWPELLPGTATEADKGAKPYCSVLAPKLDPGMSRRRCLANEAPKVAGNDSFWTDSERYIEEARICSNRHIGGGIVIVTSKRDTPLVYEIPAAPGLPGRSPAPFYVAIIRGLA
ncbi:hypothetical protein VTK56DRAFT_1786 [Thermocarpiscus australiensis]